MNVVLVTGSTDGIGEHTACQIAQMPNYKVVVHGRSAERCEKTIQMIKSKSPEANVDFIVCDFAQLTAVSRMAAEVRQRFPDLSVLICNAGVLLPTREVSVHGYEMAFQVNHLAHFALTNMLLDVLKKNEPSRVVVVSSICYDWHSIDWNDLMSEKSYEKYTQYSRTKLANHMFAFGLARRLNGTGVTCNVYEPGVVETKLLRAGGFSGSPPSTGAVAAVYLATSDEVVNVNGEYFNKNKEKIKATAESRDEELQERLWKISVELCAKVGVVI